jgi:hypothetical protein
MGFEMAVNVKTQVMLWGRAAYRCAFADCRLELVTDPTETDDESLIGEVCHIVAQSSAGPRGDSPLTAAQRDKYANLILLCRNHHKLVDDQPGTYTIARLHDIKEAHERWVRESLAEFDPAEQKDKELYASYVEEFLNRADLDNWIGWSSSLFSSGVQCISKERYDELGELKRWIFTRVWPQRIPELENAFTNFRRVLNDLMLTFDKNSKEWHEDKLCTEKFYKIPEWNPKLYKYLGDKYDFYVELVEDLMLELTRAANYICDLVRRHLDPSFRIKEGVLVVESGMYMDLTYHSLRAEYRNDERGEMPYPGLEEFKETRVTRDHHMGEGYGPDGKEEQFS